MESALIQMLDLVLAPLAEEQRENLKELATAEIAERPVISFCSDNPRTVYEPTEVTLADGTASTQLVPVEKVNVWAIGGASPTEPGFVIFAMALFETVPFVKAWSYRRFEHEGKEATEYRREFIRNFHIAQGPLTGDALYKELVDVLTDEPDDEPEPLPAKTNGAAAQA